MYAVCVSAVLFWFIHLFALYCFSSSYVRHQILGESTHHDWFPCMNNNTNTDTRGHTQQLQSPAKPTVL